VNMYANEDMMWQRLKDLQAEAENRRLQRSAAGTRSLVGLLAQRAWVLAGLATRRPPRRTWSEAANVQTRSRVA